MKNVAIKGTTKTIVFLATCKQVMHAKETWYKKILVKISKRNLEIDDQSSRTKHHVTII